MSKSISVKGARVHNLKNINVDIPLNSFTVITGVSGSGKSSLAFDTIYAEGQRRYVESLSAYARQFLEKIDKPDLDEIVGICPAISIRQKTPPRNPRSTVGTVTEIYDFLRLLFARIGITFCHRCGREVSKDSPDKVADVILRLPEGTRFYVLFPFKHSREKITPRGQIKKAKTPSEIIEYLRQQGFPRLFVDGSVLDISHQAITLSPKMNYYVLVDRLVIKPDLRQRLIDSIETCFREGEGKAEVYILPESGDDSNGRLLKFSESFECQSCNLSFEEPEPRLFSFNNPFGACPTCQGFGNTVDLDLDLVIPDKEKSLTAGAIVPWTKHRYRSFQTRLKEFAAREGIPLNVPYKKLLADHKKLILEGANGFPGIRGFFEYLERKKYKMHVRLFMARYRGYTRCHSCNGERLRIEARDVLVGEKRITEICQMSVEEAAEFFSTLQLNEHQQQIAERVLYEIRHRLNLLLRVGLEYLSLDRLSSTLSGGETQRIQLAAALGSTLVGALYVLDEPSIGLHVRDSRRLIEIIKNLRDLGNTVLVVEHDPEIISAADHIIDLGPGAGENGGEVVYSGSRDGMEQARRSLTSRYLFGTSKISVPTFRRKSKSNGKFLELLGVTEHNLKNINVKIPLGMMVCITGVSGSGKSTLVHDVLYDSLRRIKSAGQETFRDEKNLKGAQHVSDVLLVDQSPVGKTSRSNPLTYIGGFDEIRSLFASTKEARKHGYDAGHFSFNVSGGRCEACLGSGTVTVEMQFLADVELTCEECKGTRYKGTVLEVRYKGKNIHEVLNLTIKESIDFFYDSQRLVHKLKVLDEVGLGYLRLGQSATTLSGGEAQRMKLAFALSTESLDQTLYIFDEPTTGLHLDDISKLLNAFGKLIHAGASIIIIEHNLEVIKTADWIIDLGPEGGDRGGYVVAIGTPEQISQVEESYTGKFLSKVLDRAIINRQTRVNA